MAINFPTSPSLNAIHTENSLSWKYNGNAWLSVATGNTESVVATGSTQPRSLSDRFADVVNVKVLRPEVQETTAAGAAFMAGLKIGVFKSLKDISKKWHLNKEFSPKMKNTKRSELIKGWSKAIERTLIN